MYHPNLIWNTRLLGFVVCFPFILQDQNIKS
uniref:Uncharacterized protein n=1 Tax=Heterorhabditis bacteriophora TaxID=37862 RepID=A0A1I7WJ90_HETBA